MALTDRKKTVLQIITLNHIKLDSKVLTNNQIYRREYSLLIRFYSILALRCHHCGGPIQNPVSEAALNHSMPCFDCGKVQPYSDRIEQVFVAYDLYKKGMEAYEYGCLSDALPALQSCYQIRVKAMYAHHREVTEVADQLAR